MAGKLNRHQIQKILGPPDQVAAELAGFRKSAVVLSSQAPRLIQKYPKQWVAVCDGEVRASASTFGKILKAIDEKQISRSKTIVRFIDKKVKTMVL